MTETNAALVLIAEDDEQIRTALDRILTYEGYKTITVNDGAAALEGIAEHRPDAVILDVMMPFVDGLSACRLLRERGDKTPILMLTARQELQDRVTGLDAGADDYLTKPFAYPELAARVRALLRRPARTVSPVLASGDLRLDPAAHTVWRGAIMVPLTPREFSLLEYLLRHPDRVCRRSELLEHVWDANYDGLSNVVDVHIANLRRKLDVADVEAPIETVRGVGYQILVTS